MPAAKKNRRYILFLAAVADCDPRVVEIYLAKGPVMSTTKHALDRALMFDFAAFEEAYDS